MRVIVFLCVSCLAIIACDSKQVDKAPAKVEAVVSEAVKSAAQTVATVKPVEKSKSSEEKPHVPKESVSKEAEAKVELKEIPEDKAAMDGEQVYKKSCSGCHASGAAGSPKLGDATAWKARIDKGVNTLYTSAIKGIPGTAMLPKGTCAACSDSELKAAVDYMVSQVK